jgi:galactonate dehydratase
MLTDALRQMRAFRVQAGARSTFLFLEVLTSSGLTGIGEASMSGDDALAVALARQYFDDYLLGTPVARLPRAMSRLTEATGASPSLVSATAASALEQCLWDIRGKLAAVPVYELLGGGQRDQVALYANINRGTSDRSPEGFARSARSASEAGFRAVKCAPFDGVRPVDPPGAVAVTLGIERVAAVRAAIGAESRLMVDCHGRLGVDTAKAIIERLSEFGMYWIEEPIMTHSHFNWVMSAEDGSAVSDYAAESSIPHYLAASGTLLAMGEFEYGIDRYASTLDTLKASVLMPDVKHCGGLWTAMLVGWLAKAGQARLAPHNPSGPVSTLASLHVCVASPSVDMLEYQWAEAPSRETMIVPSESLDAGMMSCPGTPGLGAGLDHEVMRELSIPLDRP